MFHVSEAATLRTGKAEVEFLDVLVFPQRGGSAKVCLGVRDEVPHAFCLIVPFSHMARRSGGVRSWLSENLGVHDPCQPASGQDRRDILGS